MIEAVKIWNEPNNKSHWDPLLDPEWARFAEMTRLAGAAVRAENSTVTRVLGGMSPIDPSFVRRLEEMGVMEAMGPAAVKLIPEMTEEFAAIERAFGGNEERIRNLVAGIDARRVIALDRFLFGLGIRDIGEQTSLVLARAYETWDALKAACLAAGMDGFLVKPLSKQDLLAAIARLCAGEPLRGRLMIHDALYAETRVIGVKRRADCPACAAVQTSAAPSP